jgi:hypothetical protein
MTCNEIRELMPDLAAGLNPATPAMNEHLRACATCAGKLEEFRQTMAVLDEWQTPGPSPYFDVRLQARVREEMAKQPAGWWQWLRKPALAVSLTVLMAASISLFRSDGVNSITSGGSQQIAQMTVERGSAVGDLQELDQDHDLYSDFDVLDDLQVQQDVVANP